MSRLEKQPSTFKQVRAAIRILTPILLAEVTVQMQEDAVYSEPYLVKGDKQPTFDKIKKTLEIARNTVVAIVINGINFIIYDHLDKILEPYAIIRFDGSYEVSQNNNLGMRDGRSEKLANKDTTKIRGNIFTHHT